LALELTLVADLHPRAVRGARLGVLLALGKGAGGSGDVEEHRAAQKHAGCDGADARNSSTHPRMPQRIRHVAVDLSLQNRSRSDGSLSCWCQLRVAGNKARIAAIP